MTTTYPYIRGTLEDGRYDINHPLRLDNDGNQILLASEIEASLPGKHFVVRCSPQNVEVIFDEELSEVEESILNLVIANHRANI